MRSCADASAMSRQTITSLLHKAPPTDPGGQSMSIAEAMPNARGSGVGVGVGASLEVGVCCGVGIGVDVRIAVGVGVGVTVGAGVGVAVGVGADVGMGVVMGEGVGIGVGVVETVGNGVGGTVGLGGGVGVKVGIAAGVGANGMAVGGTSCAQAPRTNSIRRANPVISVWPFPMLSSHFRHPVLVISCHRWPGWLVGDPRLSWQSTP